MEQFLAVPDKVFIYQVLMILRTPAGIVIKPK